MASSIMEPAEIRETVRKIWSARSVKEIDNQNFQDQVGQLGDTTYEYFQNKIPERAGSEMIAAFLSGNPSKAYRRLVELRSGRSLGDLRESAESVAADIENRQSHFTFIYCNFNSSLLNAMNEDVRSAFLSGGCIEAALFELKCREFIQHKNRSCSESPTAKSISVHLGLIYNVSNSDALKGKLAEELQKNRYFQTLKEFTRSVYVLLSVISIYWHFSNYIQKSC